MWRFVYRTAIGAFVGYVIYLPTIYVVEYALYGRADSERVFYSLFYPLGLIWLLIGQDNTYLPKDELILTLEGSALPISGIIIANSKHARKFLSACSERIPHP